MQTREPVIFNVWNTSRLTFLFGFLCLLTIRVTL